MTSSISYPPPPPSTPDLVRDWEKTRSEASPEVQRVYCDLCGTEIQGTPAGRGELVWRSGPEGMNREEPALCEECAAKITAAWLRRRRDPSQGE